MTGARSKTDIRAIAKRRGHEIERCIDDHGEGLDRVRHHYQISVTESGELSESLLLQGVRPELDTCVEQVLEGWSYGAADDASFFKLKLVWNAP